MLGEPGTTLTFANGNHEWLPGSSLTGDDVTFSGSTGAGSIVRGDVNISGTLTIGDPSSSTVTFTDEANVTSYGQTLFARSGIVRFESPSAAAVDFDSVTVGVGNPYGGQPHFDTGEPIVIHSLALVYGNINGADPITIHDSFTWGSGGSFVAGGPVTCNGPSTIQATSTARSLAREFNNAAYATFLGKFAAAGSGVYRNLAGATVELRGDNTGFSGGAVDNAGLIVKTQGAGGTPSVVGGSITNSGTIHAQTGQLTLGSFGGVNSGDIIGDPGTTLRFIGSHEMLPGSSLTADNLYILSNTSNVRGDVDISGAVTVAGGTWTFTNEANVTSYGQTLDVNGGRIYFNAPAAQPVHLDSVILGLGSPGAKEVYFNTGDPVSLGSLQISPGGLHGADPVTVAGALTFNSGTIGAGGDLTANGPVTIHSTGGGRNLQRDFYNADTMTFINGGLSLSNCDLTNLPGATIDITTDGTKFALTTTATLYNNGTLIKSAGTGSSAIQNHFRNAGVVEVQTGVLEFYSSYGLTHVQTAGQTVLNGGGLVIASPAAYELQGGDLTGVGTVAGDIRNAAGTVRPGLSAGALTIDGNYTQDAGGALAIELGGGAPGEFDVLSVSGQATLDGELNIALIDGFTPAGAEFVVLTAGSIAGTFATLSGAPGFDVIYTATEVKLAAGPSLPGDVDGDCDVDIGDLGLVLTHYGESGPGVPGDADGDDDVDVGDLGMVLANFGESCP